VVRQRRPGQLIIGFAAETENRMENGRAKLLRKGADAIVVNAVNAEGVGIEADRNAASFLTLTTSIELPEMPKRNLADRILDEIITLRRPLSLVEELDEHGFQQERQDQVLQQAAQPSARRRQLIVE
jgi:phosphopantothenoylcysteine decarboxylase/phosphopantothenate--cysteine ligase